MMTLELIRDVAIAHACEDDIEENDGFLAAACPVVERLADDLSEADISIVLRDGDGRTLSRHVRDERTLSDVATERVSLRDPRTGIRVGSITLLCSAALASPLLLPVARGAAREIEQRLLDGHSARDRLLEEQFLQARRTSRDAIAAIGERTLLVNAAASRMLEGVDRHGLWARVERAVKDGAATIDLFEGQQGAPIDMSMELVHQGPQVVGAILRMRTGAERGASREPGSRPALGWEALTDTERGLAELIAEGVTNRQAAARLFMSRHTVDSHLRRIYQKLDINSRVDLTRIVTALRARASAASGAQKLQAS
jgi:DNA-binding CsgD family transcriptional regulator